MNIGDKVYVKTDRLPEKLQNKYDDYKKPFVTTIIGLSYEEAVIDVGPNFGHDLPRSNCDGRYVINNACWNISTRDLKLFGKSQITASMFKKMLMQKRR